MLITVTTTTSSPMRVYINPPARVGQTKLYLGLGHVSATRGNERLTIGHKFLLLQTPVEYEVWYGQNTGDQECKDVIGIRENLPALKAWKQNKDSIFWFSKVGLRLDKENKRVTLYVPNCYHIWIDRNTVF